MVLTCYLFAETLDEENGLSICLDLRGGVYAPLAQRSIAEIQALQVNAKTVVVISAQHAALHMLELPWLNEKKARAAIPYALEEYLAQPVQELHFAFDRAHYRHNHYLVVVIDQAWLRKIIQRLEVLELDFSEITLDWFALPQQASCCFDDVMLVNNAAFKGALNAEWFACYQPPEQAEGVHYTFVNSPVDSGLQSTKLDEPAQTWIAKQLQLKAGINLCQAEFAHSTRTETSKQWHVASLVLLGLWLLAWVVVGGYQLRQLTRQLRVLDAEIVTIYHDFYPRDKQVISPEFRIRQKLGTGQADYFWPLYQKLIQISHSANVTITQWRFQANMLSLTLTAPDFSVLDQFQENLQQVGMHVTQAHASSEQQAVLATLELRL